MQGGFYALFGIASVLEGTGKVRKMKKNHEIDTTTVGGRIKFLRNQANMTQEELAEALGLENRSSLASYETNRRDVSGFLAVCLAQILNSTTDYILTGYEKDSFIEEIGCLAGKVKTEAVRNMIIQQIKEAIKMEEALMKNKKVEW